MDLSGKYKTMKLLEEKRERSLGLGTRRKVLGLIPKAWSIKGKFDKFDLIKIRIFDSAKDFVEYENKGGKVWKTRRKVFVSYISDK